MDLKRFPAYRTELDRRNGPGGMQCDTKILLLVILIV